MTHIHHIIPKHAGGTNDPSNLFKLSVLQHTLAHRNRSILTGDWRDWIAWKMLIKAVPREEGIRLASKLANLGSKHTPEHIEKNSIAIKKAISEGRLKPPTNKGLVRNSEWKSKVADKLKGNSNGIGKKWITNGDIEYCIKQHESPPAGYQFGRSNKVDFRNKRFI